MSQISAQENPFHLLRDLLDEAGRQSAARRKVGLLDERTRIEGIMKRKHRFDELRDEAWTATAKAHLGKDDVEKVLALCEECLDAIDGWFPAHTESGGLTPESAAMYSQSVASHPQAERELRRLAAYWKGQTDANPAQINGQPGGDDADAKADDDARTDGQPYGDDAGGNLPLRLTATMKKILSTCRRKHFKGETLANKVGLEYNYARKVFAKLVKAGKLRNDPDKGYRTV